MGADRRGRAEWVFGDRRGGLSVEGGVTPLTHHVHNSLSLKVVYYQILDLGFPFSGLSLKGVYYQILDLKEPIL